MLTICAQNGPIRIPKRVARAKRAAESRRLDSFKDLRDGLKKTIENEKKLFEEYKEKVMKLWNDEEEADEVDVEIM